MSDFDWIVIGSGFGGSVSALRLVEKGYRVLVLEKGRRFETEDFPETNWDLRRWMWRPDLGLRGIFQMTFLRHVTVLHGVGWGGGSLTYANTLPVPKESFFVAPSWKHLADWRAELAPHYETARRMLGAARNPVLTPGDLVLRTIARDMGKEASWSPTDVAVFFGEPGREVRDPYFGGEGPVRTGCTFCGACMTGCRVGAKNTLDRNYLHLALKRGLAHATETEVTHVRPVDDHRYEVRAKQPGGEVVYRSKNVVFAGGVMGTVPLLLKLREDPRGLPALSARVGSAVRTNSEALLGVLTPRLEKDFSTGVAITSIFETDENSHVEPVRYGAGSDFFSLLVLPHAPGETFFSRVGGAFREVMRAPAIWRSAMKREGFARRGQVLLYMRTLEGTLRMRLGRSVYTGWRSNVVTELEGASEAPKAFMPEATELVRRFAEKVGGVTLAMFTETLLGTPSTAHILGGACMGRNADEGVIDSQHRVFGYPGLYVIDGSSVSANPGVNPSLTITALAERAQSFIPMKNAAA